MECVSKFVKKYKCFYLTEDNINEFIFWINDIMNMNYKIKRKTYCYIEVYDKNYEFNEFKFYFDEYAVYQDNSIFTYSEIEFNKLYEIKGDENKND